MVVFAVHYSLLSGVWGYTIAHTIECIHWSRNRYMIPGLDMNFAQIRHWCHTIMGRVDHWSIHEGIMWHGLIVLIQYMWMDISLGVMPYTVMVEEILFCMKRMLVLLPRSQQPLLLYT